MFLIRIEGETEPLHALLFHFKFNDNFIVGQEELLRLNFINILYKN